MKDFPVLFQSSNSILEATIKTGQMFYSNINSWYGRPDAMLAGNPLVEGTPPGNGFSGWYEAYVSAGLYTMFPVAKPVYLFIQLLKMHSEVCLPDTEHPAEIKSDFFFSQGVIRRVLQTAC
ncbi:MAG: hypothetical protein IPG02_17525 [Ignavibacteria bacterium]|nr:hypothetical protein [Ignavibacteria bacterium]